MRSKHTSKRLRTVRRHRLALALVGAMAMPMAAPALAQNLPESGAVVNGTASIGTAGNQMTITQSTKGAIIDWGSFSIGAGYGVTFNQQFGNNSVTLNRVVSALGPGYSVSASVIDGSLSANGSVFLINPAGITFGNGAAVNVGGLVASTLWMNSGDFINGLSTGQYVFNGFNGDPSASHQVRNHADLNIGANGLAFVGPTLWNSGAIVTNGGNIGFGAGTAVTLDFVGDGLTQVTINAAPTVDSAIIQDRFGTMTADGRQILLRTAATAAGTGGAIAVSGTLRAQSIANVNGRIELTSVGGAVMVGAPGIFSDAGSPYTVGTLDVSGQAGENGGSVLIQGSGFSMVNDDDTPLTPADPLSVGSMINASGGANGGQVDIQTTGAIFTLPLSLIAADGTLGNGGQVRIQAGGNMLLAGTDITAASKAANGGAIALLSSTGSIATNGTLVASGAGNGGRIDLLAPNGAVNLVGGFATASGGADGGDVQLTGDTIQVGAGVEIRADGGSGSGGTIGLASASSLAAYGLLSARGGSTGGSIGTFSGGTFDIRGLVVDAGSTAGAAGLWTLWAPDIDVVDGADVGPVGGTVLGSNVQDADINNALATGTSVTLRAGTVPSDGGDIFFGNGVDITYAGGGVLAFRADANGGIGGTNFGIGATAGSLSMAFNADASNLNNGFAGIGFSNATLASNGADILFYGQSDTAAGFASNYATGVGLANSTISTAGGNVLIRGSSTGADASADDAGVVLDNTSIDAGAGGVSIHGTGADVTSGVILSFSNIAAGSGGALIDGQAIAADGVYANGSDISTSGGDISVTGIGGARGVYLDGALYSAGGDIVVHGEGGTGNGLDLSGPVDSAGGDIAMYGASTDATGLEFGGGYYDGIVSAGGDISLTGHGATGGVALYQSNGSGPIVLFAPADVDTINSAGGDITITGTASAADAIGVYSYGVDLIGGAGDVTVDGSSPLGVGILLANGAGIGTTTGAITLIGEGANFGLDIADGAIDTDSGDISLTGDALAAGATAGVRVAGGGLSTNGGSIAVTGSSAGGVGVQLGDGGAFAIDSNGGAISIDGTGVTAGVSMQGNTVDSGGGAIDVAGIASGAGAIGVDLTDARLIGTSGDVTVLGNAAAGTGVNFAGQSGISTTTGGIGVTGIGATVGLALTGGELSTDSGHFDLRGRGTGAASDGLVIGQGISIATNGGGIELSGEGGSGAGISLAAGSSVDAGNSLVVIRAGNDGSSDAIRIGGTIASSMAVNLRPGGVDANGGLTERTADAILLGGGTAGFALSGAELALIDTPQLVIGSNLHAGAIQVLGGIARAGNLTLQNDGGSGGIDIQAAVDVGNGTLALSSGGDITQGSSGAITAHSLLARAGGDVLLADANNNVAANTLAGSAGGDFEYQDVDALAIGSVSALGMNAGANGLASIGATGIAAGGNVFVRNLAGDMTLNAGVSGVNIDLVTANTLQNPAGASLLASGDWRVWANTWVGETRGGLAGDGNLPNLYGCAFLGQCGVTVPGVDNHFIYVQQPTALISFDNFTREYGLPNPVFTFTVTGAILGDSGANVASGTGTTTATIGSNVGNYAITGNFSSAAGYRIQFVPGTLAITPATLLFTADPFVRYLGTENPLFTGTVTGFRNGDTVQSVFGDGIVWNSPAGLLSPIGFYPINGGTSAINYVFTQAPGNATALQIIPLPQLSSTPIDLIRETVNTYVYDRNFGGAPMCALNASLEDQQLASTGDELSNEWSKVRSRPNLTNCFETERKNGCGDF